MRIINNCPVCKSKNFKDYLAMPEYKLAKCLVCGMVWDLHPPQNPENNYIKDYFINDNPKGGYANYFEGMKINKKTFSDRLKRISKRIKNKGKLLDVGCALGDCLEEARSLGWQDVLGIDPSGYAIEIARKRKLTVKEGTLDSLSYPENHFDLILSQDEIEHLVNPVGEFKIMFKILRSGGWLYVVTPDIGGFWAKLLGQWWYHYKPQEHLVYFNQKTLRQALIKAGFNNIKISKTAHIMSIEYIIKRLKYYSPSLFKLLTKLTTTSFIKDIPLKVYAGEIEAWAQKS